jgi:hypothetical protein
MALYGYKPKWKKALWVSAFRRIPAGVVDRLKPRTLRWLEHRRKKQRSDRLYISLAKEFRSQPGNLHCHGCVARHVPTRASSEVHHVRGRLGTLKFDTRFFCPTCRECGRWVHANPAKARALGLLAQAGDWRRAPEDAETERIRKWMEEEGIS